MLLRLYYLKQFILKCFLALFIKIYLCYKGFSIDLLCKNAIRLLVLCLFFCLDFFNICFLIFCYLVPPFDLHKKRFPVIRKPLLRLVDIYLIVAAPFYNFFFLYNSGNKNSNMIGKIPSQDSSLCVPLTTRFG